MTYRTARQALLLVTIVAAADYPTRAAAADEHLADAKRAKAAVACQSLIAKVGAKVLADKLKALDVCSNAALTCVQTKHDKADCLGKAGATCTKQLDGATLALAKAAAKIVGAKSCASDLRLPDLLGGDGLGLGELAGDCQTDFGLDVCVGLDPLAQCLVRSRDRAAGAIFGETRPRASELLTLFPNGPLPPVPGLPAFTGCASCGAPPEARKAVEQCGKALTKTRQSLGASLEKILAGCAQKVLACVQTKSDDAKCLPSASAGCGKATDKIDAALAKFAAGIAKKCDATSVDFAALADPSGLGIGALHDVCAGAPSDAASLATCLQSRARCTTAEIVRESVPRIDGFAETGHFGGLASDLTASCSPGLTSLAPATARDARFIFGSIIKFITAARRPQGADGTLGSGGRPAPTGVGRGVIRVSGPPRFNFGSIGKIQFRYKISAALSRGARVAPPPTMIVAVQRADVSLDDHFEVPLAAPPPGVTEVDDEIDVTYADAVPGCAFDLALATKIDGVVSEYTPILQVLDTQPQPTPTTTTGGPTATPTPTVTATPPPSNVSRIIDATGDGGGNTLADALGLAADAGGTVFVTGATTDNAFKRAASGTVTEIVDATGDGTHALNFPAAVAVAASGNVYVGSQAGFPDSGVFKIASMGGITEIIDVNGDGTHPLSSVGGLAVDGADTVYVTGAASGNAFKVTSGGTITQIIDSSGDGVHTLSQPLGIAVDSANGDVFVAGGSGDNVFKITSTGVVTQIIDASGDGTHSLGNAVDVAVDGGGNVYVVGGSTDNAFKIASGGGVTQIIDSSGDGTPFQPFALPVGVAVHGTDVFVMGGSSSRRGYKIASGGAITRIIDPSGDGAGHTLQLPGDIATDGLGNVYVSDRGGNQVFKIATP